MDHWPNIERLAFARGVKEATVKKWRQRGVPWRWRVLLSDDAKRESLWLPPTAFEAVAEHRGAA